MPGRIKSFKVKVFNSFFIQQSLFIDIENLKAEYAKNIRVGMDILTISKGREELASFAVQMCDYTILWDNSYFDASITDATESVIEIIFGDNSTKVFKFYGLFPDNWDSFSNAIDEIGGGLK